jgi:hypothetical protein
MLSLAGAVVECNNRIGKYNSEIREINARSAKQ